ncbi:H/ACA ribonucleoprotein complex subunit 2-like protein [Sarcoptes scabiei]|uniref:H/ACA ribonucleoprotein complex subunit 2-like protein n=2 Tax=Sarcoptes scabiei TaxID=52283 RepID=A0A834VAW2_SARSC|nr:H/ACA ribonucleoprotein complex subunit 2-like protein [Sarcoptes scabiei]
MAISISSVKKLKKFLLRNRSMKKTRGQEELTNVLVQKKKKKFVITKQIMGKRSLETDQSSEEIKSVKKHKNNVELDETIDANETITEENNVKSLPRTRKDLIELPYDKKLDFVSVIANPMAGKKLAKKLFKLMRKASKISRKELLRIGLKEVQHRIRKGERGLIVFAGDVTPIEIMCHLPAICEEKDLSYVYVPFRTDISTAIGVRRPALMVLIKNHDDYNDLYQECENKIKELTLEFLKSQ